MRYLLVVSLVWSFSFGLVKVNLGNLDPSFAAFIRLLLALPVFLPFLRWGALSSSLRWRLVLVGAVQYGVMYALLFQAFGHLNAYQVALFTIFTPIYVSLIHDLQERRFRPLTLALAAVAVIGAGVIRYRGIEPRGILTGFVIMQGSNLCFAWGQLEYRRLRNQFSDLGNHQVYALLFIGASSATGLLAVATGGITDFAVVTAAQWGALAYLGVLASGLGFFWWNQGATLTAAATLAVFNNLKVPLAVAVSVLVFGESVGSVTEWIRLLVGGGLMLGAVVAAERFAREPKMAP